MNACSCRRCAPNLMRVKRRRALLIPRQHPLSPAPITPASQLHSDRCAAPLPQWTACRGTSLSTTVRAISASTRPSSASRRPQRLALRGQHGFEAAPRAQRRPPLEARWHDLLPFDSPHTTSTTSSSASRRWAYPLVHSTYRFRQLRGLRATLRSFPTRLLVLGFVERTAMIQ